MSDIVMSFIMLSVIMLGVVAPLKLQSIFKFQFVSNLLPLKHLLEQIGDFEADSKLVERPQAFTENCALFTTNL
jgi:hypothetical protein